MKLHTMRELAKQTREARVNSPFCESAKEAININDLLKEIADNDFYRIDYKESTSVLLYEDVPYETAKSTIYKIINDNLFSQ